MAPALGLENAGVSATPLERALRDEPTDFEFFQAVRQIERLRAGTTSVGRSVDPTTEPVRFAAHPSIAFPPGEIHSLELDGEGPARMSVNFMGLTGPVGVLPYHYTLLVRERAAARDTALREFLDLFHHRLISLFYRAWEKHRFTIAYEKGEDRLRGHVLDLAGVGLERQQGGLRVSTDAVAFYAALMVGQLRSAAALQRLLRDFFDAPVEVVQFVGAWDPIGRASQCELGEEQAAASELGLGTVVGDEVWNQQSRVRVRVGPLPRSRYDQFLPGGAAHQPLRDLLHFFGRDELDFELQLVLTRDDVPGLVLGGDEPAQPLGWCTWLRSTAFSHDAEDTVLALDREEGP